MCENFDYVVEELGVGDGLPSVRLKDCRKWNYKKLCWGK